LISTLLTETRDFKVQTIKPVLKTIEQAVEPILQVVRCPNCGSPAERRRLAQQIHTQCSSCDYLMTTCSLTGRVIEAYAPGLSVAAAVRAIAASAAVATTASHIAS
jgi:ribosomal protein L37AE/L43A